MQPFTLLIKPSGSDCNLDCKYCFYKDRAPQIGQLAEEMYIAQLEGKLQTAEQAKLWVQKWLQKHRMIEKR